MLALLDPCNDCVCAWRSVPWQGRNNELACGASECGASPFRGAPPAAPPVNGRRGPKLCFCVAARVTPLSVRDVHELQLHCAPLMSDDESSGPEKSRRDCYANYYHGCWTGRCLVHGTKGWYMEYPAYLQVPTRCLVHGASAGEKHLSSAHEISCTYVRT
jgi:hypothetical protein